MVRHASSSSLRAASSGSFLACCSSQFLKYSSGFPPRNQAFELYQVFEVWMLLELQLWLWKRMHVLSCYANEEVERTEVSLHWDSVLKSVRFIMAFAFRPQSRLTKVFNCCGVLSSNSYLNSSCLCRVSSRQIASCRVTTRCSCVSSQIYFSAENWNQTSA
jgi:hypothetical protein